MIKPVETRERVTALFESWNARDLDAFVAQLSPDVYWHDLGMPHPRAIGREAVKLFSQSILRAFPDFTYALRGALCVAEDGRSCVAPFLVTATHTGELSPPGFAPTNRQVRIEGLDYLHLDESHVTRIETRFDPFDAAEQLLGIRLRPPARSLRERVAVRVQRSFAFWRRRAATGLRAAVQHALGAGTCALSPAGKAAIPVPVASLARGSTALRWAATVG